MYILDKMDIHLLSQNTLKDPHRSRIRFSKIESDVDLAAIKLFRLKMYKQKLNYMLHELSSDGSSVYDDNSFIFAAWIEDEVIATIRLTKYPFETLKYISEDKLTQFLGNNCKQHYLEWTRLIINTSHKIQHLTKALTVFAGLTILNTTHYTHYFGYTRPSIRRLLSTFELSDEKVALTIPERGSHLYYLLKGSFVTNFNHLFEE